MSTFAIAGTAVDTEDEHFAAPRAFDPEELGKLRQFTHLRSASFTYSSLDDRGLAHVVAISSLDNLCLQGTQVSDAGIALLGQLPRLRYLRLKDNRQLTNACTPHLAQLRSLVDLQLHETSIDQHGLAELGGCDQLDDLLVSMDGNTVESLLALSRRLPECRILVKSHFEIRDGEIVGR